MADGTRSNRLDDKWRKDTDDKLDKLTQALHSFMLATDAKIEALINHSPTIAANPSPAAAANHLDDNLQRSSQFHSPRFMRLDVPRFDGTDPTGWVFKIEKFFDFHSTPDDQRLLLASFHLDGPALSWFQWMQSSGLINGWKGFLQALTLRFGPSLFEDHRGALAKLQQTSTVAVYQEQFERLSYKVTGLSETFLISFFISGLKPELKRELLIAQPVSLLHAMALARLHEQKFHDYKSSWRSLSPSITTGSSEISPTVTKPLPSSTASKTLPVRKLSPAEIKARRDKGLCYYCDDKFMPGHKCKNKFMLLVGEDDESCETNELFRQEDEIVANAALYEISLHAFAGQVSPKTIRLKGNFHEHQVQILIDSGSTHNFIQEKVALRLGLLIYPCKKFRVYVGNGEFLLCTQRCKSVPLLLQGHFFTLDLFILPLEGADIVLGIQWLELLGPILTDYKMLTMEFEWEGVKVQLKGEPCINGDPLPRKQLHQLYCTKGIASLYHLKISVDSPPSSAHLPSEVQSLLQKFDSVFSSPTELPPHREFDHQIHLLPGSKPVTVRPYKYPHFQKGEIEKLVSRNAPKKESFKQDTSPFSSPVLLVKKKMVAAFLY
ncbi:uncharacterized protein LOC122671070 [Telopea speciosissima]|uniref:uncharacterized protein LOC122671070 n=1 Tax=Telopea speciosissima TaxID=54955 RepID=UPI001CC6E138|nr:uncharacterized protein LOC122671070 [Telopea speciosissima]